MYSGEEGYLINLNDVRMYEFKNRDDSENFCEDMKKVFEPSTATIHDSSENVTKTLMATYKENSKAPANLSDKLLEKLIGTGNLASYVLFLLS